MIVYHGSENIITKPIYDFRNNSNDYGAGFYTTAHKKLAGEWACRKNNDGFINRYELDTSGLKICRLNSDEYSILNWLALLTRYRGYWQKHSIAEEAKNYLQEMFLVDVSSFDIVVGYRADDSYFSFAQDFISGVISLECLSIAMRLGDLGEQTVIKSDRAFDHISYIDSESAFAELYFQKKTGRDLAARRRYAELKKEMRYDETFMIDIIRGRKTADDICL